MSFKNSVLSIIFAAILGAISSVFLRTDGFFTRETALTTANYQTEKSHENWLKENEISNQQKSHELQLAAQSESIANLTNSYNQLYGLRDQYYYHRYPLAISRILCHIYPNEKICKENYDKSYASYVSIEPTLIGNINNNKAIFKALLVNAKNSFVTEDSQKYITAVNECVDQFLTEIDENSITVYYLSQLKSTNNIEKSIDLTYFEYKQQSQSNYNLPYFFDLLIKAMEKEYNSNKNASTT